MRDGWWSWGGVCMRGDHAAGNAAGGPPSLPALPCKCTPPPRTAWHNVQPPATPLPCRSVGRPIEKREGDGAADFSQLLHRDGSVFSVVYPKDLEQPE